MINRHLKDTLSPAWERARPLRPRVRGVLTVLALRCSLVVGLLCSQTGWATPDGNRVVTELHGSTSTNSAEEREAQYQNIENYSKGDERAYQALDIFMTNYPSDPRIPALCETLTATWNAWRATNPSPVVQMPPGIRHCPHPSDNELLWGRGISLFNQANYKEAQKYFFRIAFGSTEKLHKIEARFYSAECSRLLNNAAEACKGYKQFMERYSDHDLAEKAKVQLKECNDKQKN